MASSLKIAKDVAGALVGGVTDRRTSFGRRLEVLGVFIASGLRLASGIHVGKLGPRPQQRLILWDFERCSFSRMVREALSVLDLDAEVRPCPVGGTRFRPQLKGPGVPQLEDPNTGEVIVGSRTIVAHLYARYGAQKPPVFLNLEPVRLVTALSIRAITRNRGANARPSKAPAQLLELWGFEASPFSRMVRATLSELELPYVLHNVAKGSPKRKAYVERSGRMQFPFLVDPNTGVELFESVEIQRYLLAQYGA